MTANWSFYKSAYPHDTERIAEIRWHINRLNLNPRDPYFMFLWQRKTAYITKLLEILRAK